MYGDLSQEYAVVLVWCSELKLIVQRKPQPPGNAGKLEAPGLFKRRQEIIVIVVSSNGCDASLNAIVLLTNGQPAIVQQRWVYRKEQWIDLRGQSPAKRALKQFSNGGESGHVVRTLSKHRGYVVGRVLHLGINAIGDISVQ